jgi:hypothetical protein
MARSITFQSRSFGIEPSRALEEKQAEEARQHKRGMLYAKPGWSEARKRAEALFDIPASASPGGPMPRRDATSLSPGRSGQNSSTK